MPSASRRAYRKRSPQTPPPTPTAAGLDARIHDRVQKRLGPRIRDLNVVIDGKNIRLEGRCVTYYSKQLAQHAALGVIEDENLENAIKVACGH